MPDLVCRAAAWSAQPRSLAGLVCAVVALGSAWAAEPLPNFAPASSTGWLAQDDEFIAPPSGPGPVRSDPAHQYISFYKFRDNPHPVFRVADLGNPILQLWTRERLREANQHSLSGKVNSIPKERCWPVGVRPRLSISCKPRPRSR
jgi:hypothetical protein